jgi:hypothetical protein
MGRSKEMFQKMMEEDYLGAETRAYVVWLEQEEYQQFKDENFNKIKNKVQDEQDN